LEHIAGFAVTAIPGADGAGLTLFDGARADTVVATSPFVRAVDEIQYAMGEGPCITAARQAQTVRLGSVGQDADYPQFGPQAAQLGVHSMLSLPLFSEGRDGEVLGSINVYARSFDAFDERAQELGELFAVPAAISVRNAQALSRSQVLAERLQAALVTQAAAEQEVGALLVQAVQAKHGMVSRMSHELRTPLNEVLGNAQLLRLSTLSAEQRSLVDGIMHGGWLLLAMIDDVLQINAVTGERVELARGPVLVRELLAAAVGEITPLAHAAGTAIPEVEAEAGLHVDGDREKLLLVLHHLLSNAVKFGQVGDSITVRAEAVTALEPGAPPEVAISVTDTGPGIAAADLANLFVPFDRLGVTSRVDGAGLGLALAQHLVQLMGGRLDVESELGQGSTFSVILPMSTAPHPPPAQSSG
jgi:signal transduction histidine kinase